MTGIVRDNIFLEHEMGFYHPESPERLRALYSMLDSMESSWKGKITYTPVRKASLEELQKVHDPAYIQKIAETEGKSHVYLDPDTSTSPKSYEAALKAAGSFTELSLMVFRGDLENGFAFIRPPGHHAERDRAMGFCIFNNVAVAAEALIENGAEKVAIVDWDLHHGNGTCHTFYSRKDVLYFSTHQYPYYPGTGAMEEMGEGEGKGFTINLPLPYGCGDDDYVYLYKNVLVPVIRSYRPDIVLVSAGFDPHVKDPLGGMSVTEEGFAIIAYLVKNVADEVCSGKVAVTLEGGYSIDALRESCKKVLEVLMGDLVPPPERIDELSEKGRSKKEPYLERLRKLFEGIWEL